MGIIILLTSFVIVVLGFFISNKANNRDQGLFGLSRIGTTMLIIASVGFIAGIFKEIESVKDATKAKKEAIELQQILDENSKDLKSIKAKLDGVATQEGLSDEIKTDIIHLSDQISAVASSAKEGDFRMSDFSASHFGDGNFSKASFENSLMNYAMLQGAIITNSNLNNVDFSGSIFKNAKFCEATLDSADFRGTDLSKVIVDSKTKYPNKH